MLQLPWIWFVIAGVTILAEIFTGTFYFLLVAFGFLVAGILGVFGIPFYIQLLVCTLIILFSLLILRQYIVAWRARYTNSPDKYTGVDSLDVGEAVWVTQWEDHNPTTKVRYRGSTWQAELLPGTTRRIGPYVIHAVHGSKLVLAEIKDDLPT